jgi:membrane-bound inhibitor of C-type lysozyme
MKAIKCVSVTAVFAVLLPACMTQPHDAQISTITYNCGGGVSILASYPDTSSATIEYKNKRFNLRVARSASGARYVGDGVEWWTKGAGPGSHGTLFQHNQDGTSGKRLESCAVK